MTTTSGSTTPSDADEVRRLKTELEAEKRRHSGSRFGGYSEVRDYNPDRHLTSSSMRWILWIAGILIFAGAITAIGTFAFGWFAVPLQVAGPQNVQAQFDQMLQMHKDSYAAAGNVCSARKAIETASNADEKTQRVTQAAAYEQTYRRNKANYDAQAANVFKAGVVRPFDSTTRMTLPDTQPDLEAAVRAYC